MRKFRFVLAILAAMVCFGCSNPNVPMLSDDSSVSGIMDADPGLEFGKKISVSIFGGTAKYAVEEEADVFGLSAITLVSQSILTSAKAPPLYKHTDGTFTMHVPNEVTDVTLGGTVADGTVLVVSNDDINISGSTLSVNPQECSSVSIIVTSNEPISFSNELLPGSADRDDALENYFPSRTYLINFEKEALAQTPVQTFYNLDIYSWAHSQVDGWLNGLREDKTRGAVDVRRSPPIPLKGMSSDELKLYVQCWLENGKFTKDFIFSFGKIMYYEVIGYDPAKHPDITEPSMQFVITSGKHGKNGSTLNFYINGNRYVLLRTDYEFDPFDEFIGKRKMVGETSFSGDRYSQVTKLWSTVMMVLEGVEKDGSPGFSFGSDSGGWVRGALESVGMDFSTPSALPYLRSIGAYYHDDDENKVVDLGLSPLVDGTLVSGSYSYRNYTYSIRVPSKIDDLSKITLLPVSFSYTMPCDVKTSRMGPFISPKDSERATVTVDAGTSTALKPGQTKRVSFNVTSEDGLNTYSYYVYVTRRINNPFDYSWASKFTNNDVYLYYKNEAGDLVDTRPKTEYHQNYEDGDLLLVNKAKEDLFRDQKGANIVIVMDGFGMSDFGRDGFVENQGRYLAELFLSRPVVKDFKDHFNIWLLMSPSRRTNVAIGAGVDGSSAKYNRWASQGSSAAIYDLKWAIKPWVSDIAKVSVMFVANGPFGGFALSYGGYGAACGDISELDYRKGGGQYWMDHEMIGHIFADLTDDYVYKQDAIPADIPYGSEEAPESLNVSSRDYREYIPAPEGDAEWAAVYASHKTEPYSDPKYGYTHYTYNMDDTDDPNMPALWLTHNLAWRNWLKVMYMPPWKDFMSHKNYITDVDYSAPPGYTEIGLFEGGGLYRSGRWRSSAASVMRAGGGFNGWQRYVIWQSIGIKSEKRLAVDYRISLPKPPQDTPINPFGGKFTKPSAVKEFLRYDIVNTGKSSGEIENWINTEGNKIPEFN